jgi:hypothetical protein
MGFLSRFDQTLANAEPEFLQRIGSNVDPGRTDLGKAMAIGDPLGTPFLGVASGNLGPFGTPTEKGVANPLAVSGVTDVAHDKGAEIAAIIAAGTYGAGFLGGTGAETADAGLVADGGEAGLGAASADTGLVSGEEAALGGFDIGQGLAESGQIATDANPELTSAELGTADTFSSGPIDTQGYSPELGTSSSDAPAGSDYLGTLKKAGLSPTTLALLGISGIQAFSKPQVPEASKTLSGTATAGAAQASGVIQSGGTSSPAWTQQKASIDATIDQQLKEQTAAMLQQAQNSGMGTDSQVTQQQINKLKDQLETQRQTLYAQAQGQNVQAALQQLGISDQALSNVANTQFQASNQAKQQAASTAELALLLAANSK